MTSMDDTTQARVRWFHPTPGRFVLALLAVEVLLWLSERFGWLGWHKGYAVLTCMASVGVAMLLMLAWFGVALLFRWRFQFSLRLLLVLVVAVALPCSWLAVEMKRAREQREHLATIERLGVWNPDWVYEAENLIVSPSSKPGQPLSRGSGSEMRVTTTLRSYTSAATR